MEIPAFSVSPATSSVPSLGCAFTYNHTEGSTNDEQVGKWVTDPYFLVFYRIMYNNGSRV